MQLNDLSLKDLIDICSNPEHDQWQNAWLKLLDRYKNLIYFFISKSCTTWQISRLDLQKNDAVNDIFSEVLDVY